MRMQIACATSMSIVVGQEAKGPNSNGVYRTLTQESSKLGISVAAVGCKKGYSIQ